jgi:hypothetical protein
VEVYCSVLNQLFFFSQLLCTGEFNFEALKLKIMSFCEFKKIILYCVFLKQIECAKTRETSSA